MPVNPYNNIYPIEHVDFLYGRQGLMTTFVGVFSNLQYPYYRPPCISLVGLTRSGKTSILNALASVSAQQVLGSHLKDTLFIRVDCSGLPEDTPAAFWRFMTSRLTRAVAEKWPGFSFKPQPAADATGFENFHWHLLQITQQQCFVAFLFDEFDRVAGKLPRVVADNLRFLLDDLPHSVWYTIATRRSLLTYPAWSGISDADADVDFYSSLPSTYFEDNESNAHNNAEAGAKFRYLGLLEDAQPNGVRDFIWLPAHRNGVDFTAQDVDFAIYTGARHPDLTRLTCQRLYAFRERYPQGIPDYQGLYRAAHDDFARYYSFFWPELSQEQQEALIYFATRDSARSSISYQAVGELQNLGLVISWGDGYSLFSPILEDIIKQQQQPARPLYFKPTPAPQRPEAPAATPGQPYYPAAPRMFVPQAPEDKPSLMPVYIVCMLICATGTFDLIAWLSNGAIYQELGSLVTTRAFLESALIVLLLLAILALIIGMMWQSLRAWERRWKRKRAALAAKGTAHQAGSPAEAGSAQKSRRDAAVEFSLGAAQGALAGVVFPIIVAILLHLLHL